MKEILDMLDHKIQLSENEKNRLLYSLNSTQSDFPNSKTIVDLFEEQVEKTPDFLAINFGISSLSYKEVNDRANQLAHYLIHTYQIVPDELIGIELERSEWIVIGILGILKSGGAYVPISPDYPEQRKFFIRDDAKLKVVLDLEELNAFIEKNDCESYPNSNPRVQLSPNNLIYVIYTSGSTGNPKGCMLEHGGLVNRLNWMQKSYSLTEKDCVLQKTTFTFDVSVWELLWWSLNGASVSILKPGGESQPEELISIIESKRVTVLHFVPSMLGVFLEYLSQNKDCLKKLSSLKQVYSSGEALLVDHVRRFKDLFPDLNLMNLYGPTEASIDVSYYVCNSNFEHTIPIGKPIDNTSLYLLEPTSQELVAFGSVGEICIGGVGLARGYLNRPELTTKKFIPNPYISGERLYRTGDLGKWREDGNIEYLGRIDDQVKIRGYRIELGEIEQVLSSHPSSGQLVVTAISLGNDTAKDLVVYYTGEATSEELQEFLKERLPHFMVPAFYVKLDKIPLNVSGKADRKSLPMPENTGLQKAQYVAPRSETEEQLVIIWADILSIDESEISVKADFFKLGGNSIRAIKVIGKIQKIKGVKLTLRDFFTNPTIESLTELISKVSRDPNYSEIPVTVIKENFPLSPSQKRIWVLSQFDGANDAYVMPYIFIINSHIEVDAFKKAYKSMIYRHDALRTVFISDEFGSPTQHVLDSSNSLFQVTFKDLSFFSLEERKLKLHLEIAQECNSEMDISRGPLIRCSLFKEDEQNYSWVVLFHHLIGDGWSSEVFFKEFYEFYKSEIQKRIPNLETNRINYKDYTVWQIELLKTERVQSDRLYWLNRFKGEIPILEFPSDDVRPQKMTFEGANYCFKLDRHVSQNIRVFSNAGSKTMFLIVQTAFSLLLHKLTGLEDLITGTIVAGREHPDLESQIGFFVNTLPLRFQFDKYSSIEELYEVIKNETLEAFNHQLYPYDYIVAELDLQRDISRNPLFDFLVLVRNEEDINTGFNQVHDEDNEFVKLNGQANRKARFDLTLEYVFGKNFDYIAINYKTEIFKDYQIEKVCKSLMRILELLPESWSRRIVDLDIISEEEKGFLINTVNATEATFSHDKTFLDLFLENVERTPRALAVKFNNVELSYQELNEKSNQFAHYLIDRYQIQVEDIVGIELERSEAMVLVIFGILKSGAAYVPIDPNYPDPRKSFIISDANIKIVVNKEELENFNSLNANKSFSIADPITTLVPENLAYVIYTSGSTGNPKGCMLEHRGLVNRLEWMQKSYELTTHDRILQKTTYTFDVSVWELTWWAISGASVCMLEPGGEKLPERIISEIERSQITVMHFVPSMLAVFLEYISQNRSELNRLLSLKQLYASGEALQVEQVKRFKELLPQVKLMNLYGPTEASIDVSYYECENELNKIIPIGKPIDNTALYLLNSETLELVPFGSVGEICIGGVGLARGYLNRDELTKEKFVLSPFIEGERVYRTGDLGRWREDGNMEYLGRIDEQVKIKGFRIELGEIVQVLSKYHGAGSVVVVARELNNSNTKELVTYYTGSASAEELKSFLKERLPYYMVPNYYMHLEEIPLTANGKIDNKSFPVPTETGTDKSLFVKPSSANEIKLAQIWADVLKCDVSRIGLNSDFFELGGDSIKSIQVSYKLRTEGLKLRLSDIMLNGNFRFQSGILHVSNREITQAEAIGEFPLGPFQQILLDSRFFDFSDSDNWYFFQTHLIDLPNWISLENINAIWSKVVAHHDALRLRFIKENNTWRQQYLDAYENHFVLEYEDLTSLDSFECRNQIKDLSIKHKQLYRITESPNVFLKLFACENGNKLLISINHLVVDTVSWNIIFEDLDTLLGQIKERKSLNLLSKTDSYKSWVESHITKEYLDYLQIQSLFWNKRNDSEIKNSKGLVRNYEGALSKVIIGNELTSKTIDLISRNNYLNINSLFVYALKLALRDTENYRVFLEGHGREEFFENLNIERTVGWFTSLYSLNLKGVDDPEDCINIAEINSRLLECSASASSYLWMSEGVHLERAIIINYSGDTEFRHKNFSVSNLDHGTDRSENLLPYFDGELNVQLRNGELVFDVEINKIVFDSEINGFSERYKSAFDLIVNKLSNFFSLDINRSLFEYHNLGVNEMSIRGLLKNAYRIQPCNNSQKSLFSYNKIYPESVAYSEKYSASISGPFNIEILQEAFSVLLKNYPVLSSRFLEIGNGEIIQFFPAEIKNSIRFIDLSGCSNEEINDGFERFEIEADRIIYDLESDPLYNLTVLKLNELEHHFVWTQHHIILDGWSNSILIKEFFDIYSSLLLGHVTAVKRPSQFTRSYFQWLKSYDSSRALDFWTNYLSAAELTKIVPKGNYSSESGTFKRCDYLTALPTGLVKAAWVLAGEKSISITSILHYCWSVLLAKYNNKSTVTFGTVVSGRSIPILGIEQEVGLFINTIPIVIDFSNLPSHYEISSGIMKHLSDESGVNDLSFNEIISCSEFGHDLLDHVLVFENFPDYLEEAVDNLNRAKEEFVIQPNRIKEFNQSNFDFSLAFILKDNKEVSLKFVFNGNKVSLEYIKRLEGHFTSALLSIVSDFNSNLAQVDIIDEEEKSEIIKTCNGEKVDYLKEETYLGYFSRNVLNYPDKDALIVGSKTFSYKELNQLSNQFANYLVENYSPQVNQIVPVKLNRTEWFFISVLALHKIGAAYVPVDPSYPESRIDFILNDIAASFVIDELEIESFVLLRGLHSKEFSDCIGEYDRLAYCIYTSGSTGNPKGVLIDHSMLLASNVARHQYYGEHNMQRGLLLYSFAFDSSVNLTYKMLTSGGAIVLYTESEINIEKVISLINDMNVDTVTIPPGLHEVLLDAKECKSLRNVIVAGEECRADLVAKHYVKYPDVVLFNEYGPTECTVWSTVYRAINQVYEKVPIGRPIPNVANFILDRWGFFMPLGMSGELFIAGPTVGKGYLNNLQLTNDKFVNSEFLNTRCYKTGDNCFWNDDSELVFNGRLDNQVKIRGYRIELGEIESVIAALNGVQNVIATVKEDATNKQLVCFYTGSIESDIILKEVRKLLPEYMVPSIILRVEIMPLTPHLKIDVRALFEKLDQDIELDEGFHFNEKQGQLAQVWAAVLKKEPNRIGFNSDFFNLGGDSIKAIMLISQLRKLGLELKISEIMENSIFLDMYNKIRTTTREINQGLLSGEFPLLPMQKLFLGSEFIAGELFHKNYFLQGNLFVLDNTISNDYLQIVFSKLFEHHDALRAKIVVSEDTKKQVFERYSVVIPSIVEFDFSDLLFKNSDVSLSQEIDNLNKRIDFISGPISVIGKFRFKDRTLLYFSIHHLFVDLVSWRILTEDLNQLLDQITKGQKLQLPDKSDSSVYWLEQIEKVVSEGFFDSSIGFWNETDSQLSDRISSGKSEGVLLSKASHLSILFTHEETSRIKNYYSSSSYLNIEDAIVYGICRSFHELFGLEKIKINLEGHGRDDSDLDVNLSRTVGWFTNSFPILLDFSAGIHSISLLDFHTCLEETPNKGVSYSWLKYFDKLNLDSNVGQPFIDFNYHGEYHENNGEQDKLQAFGYEKFSDDGENLLRKAEFLVNASIKLGLLTIDLSYYNQPDFEIRRLEFEQVLKDNILNEIGQFDLKDLDNLLKLRRGYPDVSFERIAELISNHGEVDDLFSLTPMQEGLHYLFNSDIHKEAYFEQFEYIVKGNLNLQLYRECFSFLFEEFDILRVVFDEDQYGKPIQIVKRNVNVEFNVTEVNSSDFSAKIRELKSSEIQRSFDLDQGPLLRLNILNDGSERYFVLWSSHHIILDGWSMAILYERFKELYSLKLNGAATPIIHHPKFGDYVRKIKEFSNDQSLSFWSKVLDGYDNVINLPGFKSSSVGDYCYSEDIIELSIEHSSALLEICKVHKVTMNSLMQVIWGLILSKYNNTKDVVFGSIVSGRNIDLNNVENLVGLLINIIPVRILYNDTDTFISLIRRIQAEYLCGLNFHFSQISEIQNQTQLRDALINHFTVFENYPENDAGLYNDSHQVETGSATVSEQNNYDFSLIFEPGKSIRIKVVYNKNAFENWTITNLKGHWESAVRWVVNNSETPLGNLEIVSDKEVRHLSELLHSLKIGYPKKESILSIFDEVAARHSQRIALLYEGQQISYDELNTKVSNLAAFLQHKYNVKKGDYVSILLPRGEWAVISILALMKCGAIYVPIDINYPSDRIEYIKADCGSILTIDENVIRNFIVGFDPNYFQFEPCEIFPEDSLYLIYTSGTTGNPKGSLISHRNVVRLFFNDQKLFDFNECDTWVMFHSYCFDFSVWEMYGALLFGGKLIIPTYETTRDVELFFECIEHNAITILNQTPSAFYMLDELLKEKNYPIISVRKIIFGGEALNPQRLMTWYENYPNIELINMYGITETTVHVTYKKLNFDDLENGISNIGKSIPTLSCLILGEHGELLPFGSVGEIHVLGEGLSKGYLNKPELTAEKFTFNPVLGLTTYKSGDIGRYINAEEIEYLGRIDSQVKVRGHRIELSEIDNIALKHSLVKNAYTAVNTTYKSTGDLVFYYVGEIPSEEMRFFLSNKLPDFMLPSFIVKVDVIPLNNNGKVDRSKLPLPIFTTNKTVFIPESELEIILCEIFEDVLKLPKYAIGEHVSFLSLGGDSIKSIQVISKLRTKGFKLRVADVMKMQSIKDIAGKIELIEQHAISKITSQRFNLSPIQNFFFNEILLIGDDEAKHFYNQSYLFDLNQKYSKNFIEDCLYDLICHHDTLRLKFEKLDGQYYAKYQDSTNGLFLLREATIPAGNSGPNRENFVLTESEKIKKSLNLFEGPLLSALLLHDVSSSLLLLSCHHTLVDLVSWRILIEDLSEVIVSRNEKKRAILPEKGGSYFQWVAALEKYASSQKVESQITFWNETLSKPTDRIEMQLKNGNSFLSDFVDFEFSIEDTQRLLNSLTCCNQIEINSILLYAVGLAAAEVLKLENVRFNMEGHGREDFDSDIQIHRTVGWFTSLFPINLNVKELGKDHVYAIVELNSRLNNIPDKGFGFGLLWQNNLLNKHAFPDYNSIEFNYMGSFYSNLEQDEISEQFKISSLSHGLESSSDLASGSVLSIGSMIFDGKFNMKFWYDRFQLPQDLLKAFSENISFVLKQLITELENSSVEIRTANGFNYTNISPSSLAKLNEHYGSIDNIMPLTPLQKGIYFHAELDNDPEMYFVQFGFMLKGVKSIDLFTRSIDDVLQSYDILKAAFVKEIDELPLQVVRERCMGYIERIDISEQSLDEQKCFLEKFFLDQRKQPFNLANGESIRIQIIQSGPEDFFLLWNNHHIILDGWSTQILLNNIYSNYSGYLNSEGSSMRRIQIQDNYRDYLDWLEIYNQDSAIEFWKSYLKDYDPVIDPFAHHSQHVNSAIIVDSELEIEEELTALLFQKATEMGITLSTLIQGLWSIIYSKYCDSDDVVFGVVTSGRPANLQNVENIVGALINTVPLRVKLHKDDTIIDHLKRIQDAFIQIEPFQFIGLSEIQSAVGDKKVSFSNAIVFENYPIPNDESSDPAYVIDPDWNHVFEKNSYNLSLIVLPEKSLRIILKYNRIAISNLTIQNIKSSLKGIIDDVVSGNLKTLDQIEILDDASRLEIVLACTEKTEVSYDYSKTIIDQYYSNNANSDHTAIIYKGREYTYAWLESESNRFASFLRYNIKIDPGEMIAVQIPRSEYMPVVLLGILKNKCAYVPIAMDQPVSRTQFILEDCRSRTLITTSVVNEFIHDQTLYPSNIDLPIGEELMYCLYTSGSTGQPKGCLLEHHSLLNRLVWMQEAYSLSSEDVILQKTPFTFDVSVWELFWWLMYGAKINLLEQDAEKDPEEIIKAIGSNHVTVIHFVPSMLTVFLDFLESSPESIIQLKSIKQIFTSGEALLGYHVRRLKELLPEAKLMNLYGPTEASIDVSYFDCKDWDGFAEEIPIGRPIINTGLLILNNKKGVMPIGSVGEIAISGVCLAQGYLNMAELTEKKFAAHPTDHGQKIYLTGDLGRWNVNGQLEYLGRIDDQVKIRGNRIELGEITSKILAFDEVKDGVVIAKKIKASNQLELVAYIVGPKIFASLRNYLAENLPSYMVPNHFVSLESMPLSSSGKVNRKLLPEPDNTGLDVSLYDAPSTDMQITLASIWAAVLQKNLGSIGLESDFFDLGGDSIKAIQVVSKLRAKGLALKLADVITKTTLEQQAKIISKIVKEISQDLVKGTFSLSPIQHLLLNTGFMNGELVDKSFFNQSNIFEISEWVNEGILSVIWNKITQHHDSWRLRFVFQNNTWRQEYAEPGQGNFSIHSYDLTLENQENLHQAILTHSGHIKKKNDLINGPLVNIGFFKCIDGNRILVTIHHLMVDIVSWQIIREDFNTLLSQIRQNISLQLPLKTDSFKDWILGHNSERYLRIILSDCNTRSDLNFIDTKKLVKGNNSEDTLADWRDYEKVCQSISKQQFTEIARKKKSLKSDSMLLYSLSKAMNETFGEGVYGCYSEKHGRIDSDLDIDITRTVGWFTDMYPVLLDTKGGLANIDEFLIFHDKVYIQTENKKSFLWSSFLQGNLDPRPDGVDFIEFNFLGEVSSDAALGNSGLKPSEYTSGPDASQNLKPKARIIVVCGFIDGYLKFNVSASINCFSNHSVSTLLNNLEICTADLISKLLNNHASLKSAVDFTFNQLTFDEIKTLESTYGDLEDVYQLSPMQKGLYYLGLYNENNQSYCVQFGEKYKGQLNAQFFKEAIVETIGNNSSLKAVFRSDIGGETLQIIPRIAEVDFEYVDLTLENKSEQLSYCLSRAEEERARPFEFSNGKLLRAKLFKWDSNTYYFLWTNHHIILDGWSTSIILAEIRNRHNAKLSNLPYAYESKPLFSNYLNWLMQQDSEKSISFWKKKLQGYSTIADLKGNENILGDKKDFYTEDFVFKLSEELTQGLELQARKQKATLNTIMQAVYGVLLSHYNKSNDIIFGAIVSGRPTQIPEVQKMVGLLFNTIPLRVNFDDESRFSDLLFDIQKYFIESQDHHYINVADLNKLGESGRNPIQTLLTFENYPTEEMSNDNYVVSGEDRFIFEQTNYNLSTIIIPDRRIEFIIKYNPSKYVKSQIVELQKLWEFLLNVIAKGENFIVADAKKAIEEMLSQKDKEKIDRQKDANLSKLKKFKK